MSLSSEHEGSSGGGDRDPTVGHDSTVQRDNGGAAGAVGGWLVVGRVGGEGVTAEEFSDDGSMTGSGDGCRRRDAVGRQRWWRGWAVAGRREVEGGSPWASFGRAVDGSIEE